ncbi:uncharacterized protein [Parasteatoda tepidariorum]|uniref:uncharacterized protein n=1 Tax=Parasteatoda tepidariorum TaxID=114398 RepID=UPI00077F8750|nr:uncharacterized protein LOC107451564 [Parasteatoda tepidariorum]
MLKSWKTLVFVTVTCFEAVLIPQKTFAHSLPDSSSANSSEDFSESQERNLIDKDPGYFLHKNSFSSDNSIIGIARPRMEDLEENTMAIELQKRVSRLVDESQRRRRQDLLNELPRMFFLPNRNGLPKYFRVQPFAWKPRNGNMKSFLADKRPVDKKYYAEPEGSEFLGGPGRR